MRLLISHCNLINRSISGNNNALREHLLCEEREVGDGQSGFHFHPAEILSLMGALLPHLNMFCPICATGEQYNI